MWWRKSKHNEAEIDDAEEQYNDSDNEDAGFAYKNNKQNFVVNFNKIVPPAMLFFMLYGPHGVATHNSDITSALSVEIKTIDYLAKTNKNMNTTSIRETRKKETVFVR